MKFFLTQTHIDAGIRSHPCSCPIARCIDEARNHVSEVSVGRGIVNIDSRKYKLPKEAISFIDGYDNQKEVEPMEFEINLEDFEEIGNVNHCWGN